jgi:hypothetical protein
MVKTCEVMRRHVKTCEYSEKRTGKEIWHDKSEVNIMVVIRQKTMFAELFSKVDNGQREQGIYTNYNKYKLGSLFYCCWYRIRSIDLTMCNKLLYITNSMPVTYYLHVSNITIYFPYKITEN